MRNMKYDRSREQKKCDGHISYLVSHISSRGMTLVEVLVTLGIFMAIMFAVATFEYNVFTYPKNISGSFQTAQDTQILLRTMLREMRTAQQGANGAYPLVNVGTSTISFFADPDNNGTIERVSYFLASSSIYRGIIQPSGNPVVYIGTSQINKMIVTNVRNSSSTPLFQYFDTNYNGTSSPLTQPVTATAVRLVKINLTLDVDLNRSPTPMTYTVQASFRNLKSNL